jgi:hypothetical protein
MSAQPVGKAAQSPENIRLAKSAHGVLRVFLRNLEPKYEVRIDRIETIVSEACLQHAKHLDTHNINQVSIDASKLACWLGGCLLDRIEHDNDHQCEVIIDALLKTLRGFLISESSWFLLMPPTTMRLLKSFLMAERRNKPKHGIWMNGLYAAFHCPLAAWKEGKAYKIPL